MSDAAQRREANQQSILSTPPGLTQVAPILARTAEAQVMPLGDQLFQRLLRHRIIFLGQQVDDDIANRICAELVLLAAEDAKRDISLYINSPGRLGQRRAGHLRHDAVRAQRRRHLRDGHGRVDGPVPALRGHPGQALRPAARPDPDAPAVAAASAAPPPTSGSRPSRCSTSSGRWPSASPSTPGRPSSRSRPTPTATAGSPPTRPRTTASSTRWSAAPSRSHRRAPVS